MQRVSSLANGLRARTLPTGTDVDIGMLYPRDCFYLWVTYPPDASDVEAGASLEELGRTLPKAHVERVSEGAWSHGPAKGRASLYIEFSLPG